MTVLLEDVVEVARRLETAERRVAVATRFDHEDRWVIACNYPAAPWNVFNPIIGDGLFLTVTGETRTFDEEDELPDSLFNFPTLDDAEAALEAWRRKTSNKDQP